MRYNQIDFFRGLMLILMSLNHTGGPINFLSSQPFGFVSAAAGFVFLSGLTAGIVYSRKYVQLGSANTSRMIWKRTWKIYYYHAGLMLFLISASILFLPIRNYYWPDPGGFMDDLPSLAFGALILKIQPYFHDILPMYVVFMVFTPALLWLFHARKISSAVAGTVALWLAAQVTWYLYPALSTYIPGSFNPFAWQLPFFSGVLMGYLTQKNRLGTVLENRTLFILAAGISMVLFAFDWLFKIEELKLVSLHLFETDLFGYLDDRKNLSFLRLVNLAALAFCIGSVFKKHKNWGQNRWICLLGRNSLQVFAFHILLMTLTKPAIDYAFLLFPVGYLKVLSVESFFVFLVGAIIPMLTTASLFIPALYIERDKFKGYFLKAT